MSTRAEAELVSGYQPFSASVVSTDLRDRSAELIGVAQPDAYIVINGSTQERADADGTWSATVTGLKLGPNTVTLEEYSTPGNKTAEATVEVPLTINPIVASSTFSDDKNANVAVVGTAQPGADVEIYQGDTMLTTAKAADITGRFSADIAAPNKGGVQTYTVKQRLDGELAAETKDVTADFGAAVSISSPVNDAVHDGGSLTFRGTGAPGEDVEIRKQGTQGVLASGKVLASGQWTATAANISDARATYVASQHSKGNNVTTSEVTLNPDGRGDFVPLAISTPADGAVLQQDTNAVTFGGTGEPDARVVIKAAGTRVLVDTTVAADGTWSGRGNLAYDTNYVLSTEYSVPGEGTITGTHRVTVKRVGVVGPLALTAPADGETVVAPDNKVTFTGTGTTGAHIEVKNSANRVLGTATVGADGRWAVAGMLAHNVMYDIEITSTGAGTGTINTKVKLVQQAGVVGPLELTAPADNETVVAPDNRVTFTGTGTAGAHIEVKNSANRVLGTSTVNEAGNWAVTGMLAHNLMYEITIVSTGTGTGTITTHVKLVEAAAQPFTVAQSGDLTPVAPNTYTFSGTGTPGASVNLFNYWNNVDGRDLSNGGVTVGSDGTWSFQGQIVAGNEYTLRAVMTPVDGGDPAERFITVTGR